MRVLGKKPFRKFIETHLLTGRDFTSYFYRVGKINPENINLIFSLSVQKTLTVNDTENCQTGVQTVTYNGKDRDELYRNSS